MKFKVRLYNFVGVEFPPGNDSDGLSDPFLRVNFDSFKVRRGGVFASFCACPYVPRTAKKRVNKRLPAMMARLTRVCALLGWPTSILPRALCRNLTRA